jgi:hypothetical protein
VNGLYNCCERGGLCRGLSVPRPLAGDGEGSSLFSLSHHRPVRNFAPAGLLCENQIAALSGKGPFSVRFLFASCVYWPCGREHRDLSGWFLVRRSANVGFDFLGAIRTVKNPNNAGKQLDRRVRKSPRAKSDRAVVVREGIGRRKRPILKSSIRRFHKILLAIYVLAIVWTSFTHAAEYRVKGNAIGTSVTLAKAKATSTRRAQLEARAYVQSASKSAGVNPRVAEWIVSHESRHHPEATGDGGESRGLWQINKAWHPEVSDTCAYDVTCSTDWSLERIRAGYVDEWSTWKYCKARFEDCPF